MKILRELVAAGISGEKLVNQFEIERANIKGAVRKMREDAERMANGTLPSATFEDVFGSEE